MEALKLTTAARQSPLPEILTVRFLKFSGAIIVMRTLALLIAFLTGSDLFGQSVLDALRQPTINADLEQLNQANQAAQSTSNALAKRATLLQRRADTLRSQVDQLEKEINVLREERASLKAAVIDCRDQFIAILELIEKKDFASIAGPVENLKATYTKSLLPKLVSKEPVEEETKNESSPELNLPTSLPANSTLKTTVPEPSKGQPPAKPATDD